jgi:hypothetical protein
VISRIASLTVYCSVYSYWVFLVIGKFKPFEAILKSDDFLYFSAALVLHVLMADFTEERVPRRTNFTTKKVNAECNDRVHLCVCLHQPSGGETSSENGELSFALHNRTK